MTGNSKAECRQLLVDGLKKLVSMPIDSGSDLKSWYEEAEKIKSLIAHNSDIVPHFVWHYLSDADIRKKDAKYREFQDREMGVIINDLEICNGRAAQ